MRLLKPYPLRFGGIIIVAAVVWLADWLSKTWIVRHFSLGQSRDVFSWFHLTYIHNTGTAFGWFQGNNGALLILSVGILGVLLYSARGFAEQGGLWGALGVALVMGGALGNMYDRIHYGYVIDFLEVRFWPPIFNVADSAISVGTACLMIGLWRSNR